MNAQEPVAAQSIAASGWHIDVSRAPHLDPDEEHPVFVVNLIAPIAVGATDGPEELAITGDEARDVLGDLLHPWTWTNSYWVLFRHDGTQWLSVGNLARVSGVPPTATTARDGLRNAFQDEVKLATATCAHAFSMADERWHGHSNERGRIVEQSLVHALAPATHTPTPLSNDVFAMAGFLTAQHGIGGLTPEDRVVAFPIIEYKIQDAKVTWVPGTPTGAPTGNVVANYSTTGALKVPFQVRCYCDGAVASPRAPKGLVPLRRGSPAIAGLGPVIGEAATPIRILAERIRAVHFTRTVLDPRNGDWIENPDWEFLTGEAWTSKGVPPPRPRAQDYMLWALLASLGGGWLVANFAEQDGKAVFKNWSEHCLEFAGVPQDVADLAVVIPDRKNSNAPFTPISQEHVADRLEALLTTVVGRLGESHGWARALRVASASVSDGDPTKRLGMIAEFLGAWLELAGAASGDDRAAFMRLWVESRIPWKTISTDVRGRVVERLQSVISKESVGEMLLTAVAANATDDKLWRGIAELEFAERLWSDEVSQGAAQGYKEMSDDALETIGNATAAIVWCLAGANGTGLWKSENQEKVIEAIKNGVKAQVAGLIKLRSRNDSLQEHDDGLWLEFDAAIDAAALLRSRQTVAEDLAIRGYVAALRAGVRPPSTAGSGDVVVDTKTANWITQSGIRSYPKRGPTAASARLTEEGSSDPLSTHNTIGSVVVNGLRVRQFRYIGEPLTSSRELDGKGSLASAEQEDDGIASLDFRWFGDLRDWLLPPLGYGLEYQGVCSAVDNAGGIVAEAARGSQYGVTTKANDLGEPDWQPEPKQEWIGYRSVVRPGAPKLLGRHAGQYSSASKVMVQSRRDARELSDESKASSFVAAQIAAFHGMWIESKGNGPSYLAQRTELAAQVVAGGTPPEVYCLAHFPENAKVSLWQPDAPDALEISYSSPDCSADFIRAWLATDQAVHRVGLGAPNLMLLSDRNFSIAAELAVFAERFESRQRKNVMRPYHPAVTAFGIEVAWIDDAGRLTVHPQGRAVCVRPATRRVPLKSGPEHEIQINDEPVSIIVRTSTASAQPVECANLDSAPQILVQPGRVVRIRVYSLIEDEYILAEAYPTIGATSRQRFSKCVRTEVEFNGSDGTKYNGFGPSETWVEALPAWDQTLYPPGKDIGELSVAVPSSGALPFIETGAQLRFEPRDAAAPTALRADWLRAVKVQRHGWHWTGYPARFPSLADRKALQKWLPAFAAVESYRESDEPTLPTYFEKSEWRVGGRDDHKAVLNSIVLHSHALQTGERPSGYLAYSVTPVVRFRAWLNPKLQAGGEGPFKLERRVLGCGDLVPGIGAFGEAARLPTPHFGFAMPLTETYAYTPERPGTGFPLSRARNGNLLVFHDALLRTDRFARQGGIGDTLEVDLLETRRVNQADKQSESYREMGPVPTQHRSPTADLRAGPPPLTIVAHAPHGLTYDIGRNGKVVQTAVHVTPTAVQQDALDSFAMAAALDQWLLAKVRVRRLVLPETQLNSNCEYVGTPAAPKYALGWRRVGTERIPMDFAVDFNSSQDGAPTVLLEIKFGQTQTSYALTVPTAVSRPEGTSRLLVSFHKGRWDPAKPAGLFAGTPYWAPQVHWQVPAEDGTLGWRTTATESCYQKDPWTWNDGQLAIQLGGPPPSAVRHVAMSDYSDPRWLLFIGTVPGTGALRPDEYALAAYLDAESKMPTLQLTRGAFGKLNAPPTKPEHWTERRDPNCYVLLVHAPPSDLLYGETGDVAPFGVLAFTARMEVDRRLTFVPMHDPHCPSQVKLWQEVDVATFAGASATLVGFQRINAPTAEESEIRITAFEELVKWVFPKQESQRAYAREALLRPNGQAWGPIPIAVATPTSTRKKSARKPGTRVRADSAKSGAATQRAKQVDRH